MAELHTHGGARGADLPTMSRSTGGNDRRELYLDVACELAATSVAGPAHHLAVSHVTLAAVAERGGVTRSALYRLWSSQQEFWSDLVEFLLVADCGSYPAITDRPSDVDVDAAQDVLLADPMPLLRTAVVAYPGTSSTRRLVAGQRRNTLARLELRIRHRLAVAGRRCIDGVAATDVATALTIIGNGLSITGRTTHAHDLTFDSPAFARPGAARSLLGVATSAIATHLTEPCDTETEYVPVEQSDSSAAQPIIREAGRWTDGQRHYLLLGLELALSPAQRGQQHRALGHVTLDAVARHAGVTRRTLTNIWSAQSHFRLDLFAHLLDRDRAAIKSSIAETTSIATADADGHAAFLLLGEQLQRHAVATATQPTHLAFAPQLDHASLAQVAISRTDRHVAACGQALSVMLRAAQRRLRAGVTVRQATLAVLTVADGAARLGRTDPDLLRHTLATQRYGEQPIVALVVDAVLSGLTEPLARPPHAVSFAAMLS